MTTAPVVQFYFDPMCPWAYQASRWIRAVRDRIGLEIDWRFFSLEEINRVEGKRHPWERPWSYGWGQMRVAALLRRASTDAVDRWYAAVGEAFFERGVRTFDPEVHAELVAGLGFPAETVAEALADPTTTDEVRRDHDAAVGFGAFGVPTLVLPGGAPCFGPVVTPGPVGDDAVALWELVERMAAFPNLYELRRPKGAEDFRHIAAEFGTYLGTRAWQTVERPAP